MATFSVLMLDIDLRLDQQQLNKPEMFNYLNELKMKNKLQLIFLPSLYSINMVSYDIIYISYLMMISYT